MFTINKKLFPKGLPGFRVSQLGLDSQIFAMDRGFLQEKKIQENNK